MDVPIFMNSVEDMKLAVETRLKYWRISATGGEASGSIEPDDDGIRGPISRLLHTGSLDLTEKGQPTGTPAAGSFTFVSTTGDAAMKRLKYKPLQITRPDFEDLVSVCKFPRHVVVTFGSRDPSVSRHVHYDETTGKPKALSLLFRIPRNSEGICCALRINLHDNTAVCFASFTEDEAIERIRRRFADFVPSLLLFNRPERAVLAAFLGVRAADYAGWVMRLWTDVNELESATQMTRSSWRSKLSLERAAFLSDHGNLLIELHAAHTELLYCRTVFSFAVKFATYCYEAMDFAEGLRVQAVGAGVREDEHVLAQVREEFGLIRSKFEFQAEHVRELIDRLKGQINVTFSLVTQRDSKVNLVVAEDSNRVALLAARDSQTMKTITVLTLVFLPPTLVTSIWSADIIDLDEYWRWRVFLFVSVGLTVTVLSIWVVYMRIMEVKGRRHAPVHIAGIGYVRDGRMLSFAG